MFPDENSRGNLKRYETLLFRGNKGEDELITVEGH